MKKSVLKSIIIAILAFVMLASFTGCDYLEGILPDSLSGIISGNQSDKTPDNQEQEPVSPTPDDSTQIPARESLGLRYELNSDGTSYSVKGIGYCTDTDLNIPSVYEGLPVTKIEYFAFFGCTSLTSVTIPDSVTGIDNYAFSGCTSLTSVTIGNGVTFISHNAFYNCTSLTNVSISSVIWIDSSAFSGCTSLQYNEYGNAYYLGNEANPYVACIRSKSDSITTATIHDNTLFIDKRAFSNCTSLTSVTIPDSVTCIDDYAFKGCTSLTSITIPDSVISIGYEAFSGCTSLTSVTIGNRVTDIGNYAFYKCTSLTSVTIPNSVTYLLDHAFAYCESLTSINFEGTVNQWKAIAYQDYNWDWNLGVPATEVICSDGTVKLK